MEDIESAPATPNPLKRSAPEEHSPDRKLLNLKGTQFMIPTPPISDGSSSASAGSSTAHDDNARAISPAPSCSTLTSLDGGSSVHAKDEIKNSTANTTAAGSKPSGAPPAKRRKLTPSEQLERQKVKEVKEQERAAEKARKEEERARKDEDKAKKDEEKRIKDLEKQKKAEEREAKKREKDLEEERRAQEKLKKERSQMRLGAFFQSKPASSTSDSNDVPTPFARRRSLSLESFDEAADKIRQSMSPAKSTPFRTRPAGDTKSPAPKPVKTVSDYNKTFLPFVPPSHTTLASVYQQSLPENSVEVVDFERNVIQNARSSHEQPGSLAAQFQDGSQTKRGMCLPSVRALADMIEKDSAQVIDLTQDAASVNPYHLLQTVPVKHIHFCEDVRPAYCGTYTKIENIKVSRAPFSRVRPDTDYDYDSECEWEEPEEGDDIGSEDEEDADSDCDDEIEGFLDDSEDAMKNKLRIPTGALAPDSTGLCWQNAEGRFRESEQTNKMRGMRLEVLLPGMSGKPIDPFSTRYWDVEVVVPSIETTTVTSGQATLTGGMLAPPRPPLQPRASGNAGLDKPLVGAAQGEKGPITSLDSASGTKRGRKPPPKTLSTEDLEEFKDAVVGSTLGKLDLLKGLKTRWVLSSNIGEILTKLTICRFPKMTHEVIKETLGHCFAQVGTSKADKRWLYVPSA
jgi:chromatin assembly factor 1 subunit A